MRVDPKDGKCRTCGGELTIIDADDAGCVTYYFGFVAGKLEVEEA